jgi:transporter family-2 protein
MKKTAQWLKKGENHFMTGTALPITAILLALLAGAAMPVQAGANAELARTLTNPFSAALVSALVGIAAMMLIVAVSRAPLPSVATVGKAPAWAWIGGFMGVAFLVLSILSAPRLGAAAFVGFAVAGQMVAALAIDHFAMLGFETRAVTSARLIGAVLVVAGVACIQLGGGGRSGRMGSGLPCNGGRIARSGPAAGNSDFTDCRVARTRMSERHAAAQADVS